MTARSFFFCVSFVMVGLLSSQEDPLHPEAKPSPAAAASPVTSSASKTPALSSAATPSPSATAPQFTDVFFKNLKARAIGPAVMGGRISDIAIDPRKATCALHRRHFHRSIRFGCDLAGNR